jgi:alpha-galactosidase
VPPSFYGTFYRLMAQGVQEGLDAIATVIPDYNETIGYELSGFVWFQGWNDMLDAPKTQEYASNLANLLRDVSKEWQVPALPIVIGELGMHGTNYTGHGAERVRAMREAERAVPNLPEFRTRALFVPTAPYAVLNGTHYNGDYHYFGRAVRNPHQGGIETRASLLTPISSNLRVAPTGYLFSYW